MSVGTTVRVCSKNELGRLRRTLAGLIAAGVVSEISSLIAVGMVSGGSSMWLKIELAGLLYELWLEIGDDGEAHIGSAVGMGSGNSSMWSKIEGPCVLVGSTASQR